jgi:nucleotide-binding universal stress UspA family protein
MKKILAAFDGSEPAMHALRMALEISDKMGADVTLAHVVPLVIVPADVPFDAGRLAEESFRAGEALLSHAAAEIGRPAIAKVCLLGAAGESLAELADSGNFDLVVVGSKGRGAVSRILLGSTADRLVHICKRPVLVVR